MNQDLRRTGIISVALHAAILVGLLLTLKPPVAPPTDDTAVTMEFSPAPGQVQRAQNPAPLPAPSPAEVPTPDLPSLEPSKPTPTEAPPPPPPPPLPPPPSPQAVPVPSPPIPPPPVQPPALSAPVTIAPAPLPAVEAPLPVPPVPPPPAPTPAKPTPQAAPVPTKPEIRPPVARPAPERTTPTQRTTSTTSQSNSTKNTADDSKFFEATMEKYHSLEAQKRPPQRQYNPQKGGADGGGDPNGLDSAKLSKGESGAIGGMIRECYTQDTAGRDYSQQWATIRVTTDGTGIVRIADVVQHSPGMIGQVFAERAARAARDPQCAKLPLPSRLLGQNQTFTITFKP